MKFCTAINCMDGRVQVPVIEFLKKRFMVNHVDVITEPAPNRILATQSNQKTVDSILERVHISMKRHNSVGIAIAGHHDCAGNPTGMEEQTRHIHEAVRRVSNKYREIPVIGLWVDENWEVNEI